MRPINYDDLSSRAKENYNFSKVASRLADYGYNCLRLSDDWLGADFVAVHIDGHYRKIQLKSRLHFSKRYQGKNIWIAFRNGNEVYVYHHDRLLERFLAAGAINTERRSWRDLGYWNWRIIPKRYMYLLNRSRVPSV